MNILFCYNLDNLSGWGSLALSYIRKLKNKKFIIFCSKKNLTIKVPQYEILRNPLDYIKKPIFFYHDSRKIIELIKFYKKEKVKLTAHFLVEPYIFFIYFLDTIIEKKVFYIIGTYSNYFSKSLFWKFFFKKLLKKIDVVIFLSSYIKNKILSSIDLKNLKSVILNPYINFEKKKLVKRNNILKLLSVGGIKSRKGYYELIRIINNLNIKYPNKFRLTIIGNPDQKEYYDKIKNFIKNNKAENLIEIKININNSILNNYYQNSDLFILVSKECGYNIEGYGIVYLEALSFGCDIMISRQSGAIDISKKFKKFYNFNSSNPKDIEKKLISYIRGKAINRRENIKIFREINKKNETKLENFLKKF